MANPKDSYKPIAGLSPKEGWEQVAANGYQIRQMFCFQDPQAYEEEKAIAKRLGNLSPLQYEHLLRRVGLFFVQKHLSGYEIGTYQENEVDGDFTPLSLQSAIAEASANSALEWVANSSKAGNKGPL